MWEVDGAHVLVILKLIGFEEDVIQLTFWPCACFEDTKVQIISENGGAQICPRCMFAWELTSFPFSCRSFMELLKRNQLDEVLTSLQT